MAKETEKKYLTLASEEIYAGRAISLHRDQVQLPNGREVSREVVRHPGAVVIVPRANDGSLLLIKQYRHAVAEEILEFPAGTLEKGELPLACAKREIIEEVSFAADTWQDLGLLYPAPGFCDELQHLFFATDLSVRYADCDEDEIIEVVRMSVAEVEQAITTGLLIDGKSMAAYTRAKLHGLLG